jgi:hypothetical protein
MSMAPLYHEFIYVLENARAKQPSKRGMDLSSRLPKQNNIVFHQHSHLSADASALSS